jgi:ribosomal protein S18 acetylase RimI-like enzyme
MASNEITLFEAEGNKRESLDPIIDASFDGWYQRHAKRTLREIETVVAARFGDKEVGVAMLKNLDSEKGYIYYIAVLPEYRGKKIGSRLLDYSLGYFLEHGATIVYASLMQEHDEANILFSSRGFAKTNFGDLSKKYGKIRAINLYRKMLVVSGEVVVFKELHPRTINIGSAKLVNGKPC